MPKKLFLNRLSFEQLIAVSALAISVIFLLAFGGQIVEIYRLRSALSIADARVARLRAEQASLEATRTHVQSDDYAERVARAELNKVRPGDQRVIVVPQPAPAPTAVPAPPAAADSEAHSTFDRWWNLLFGE